MPGSSIAVARLTWQGRERQLRRVVCGPRAILRQVQAGRHAADRTMR